MAARTRCLFWVQVVAALFVIYYPVALAQSTIAVTESQYTAVVTQSVPLGSETPGTASQQTMIVTQSAAAQGSVAATGVVASAAFTESIREGGVAASPLPRSQAFVQSTVSANWTGNITTASAIQPAAATSSPLATSSAIDQANGPKLHDPVVEEMDRKLNSTIQMKEAELTKAMKPIETASHDAEFVKMIRDLVEGGLATLNNLNHSALNYNRRTDSLMFGIKDVDCIDVRSSSFPDRSNPAIAEAVEDITDTINVALPCPIIIQNVTEPGHTPAARRRREVDSDFAAEQEQEQEQEHPLKRRYRRSPESPSEGKRFKANLTINDAIFNASLSDKSSREYKTLSLQLRETLNAALPSGIETVNDLFTFSHGSVIVDFYVDAPNDSNVDEVKGALRNATPGGALGIFSVNFNPDSVVLVNVVDGNYTPWSLWGKCNYSNFRRERKRTCTNPPPKHGGKQCQGLSTENASCSCSQVLETGGNITSPRFPQKYPLNVRCEWILKAPINNTVALELESFELEKDKKCLYDYVKIFDGNSTDAADLSGNLCGKQSKRTFESTNRVMLVVFNSDESETRKGFKASWTTKIWRPIKRKIVPQSVTVLSALYTPRINGASVPLGRATTCPVHSQEKECIFDKPVYVISRLSASALSRSLNFTAEDKVYLTLSHIMHKDLFPKMYTGVKYCVTWDPDARSSSTGSWTRRGCSVKSTNLTHTSCECDRPGVIAVIGEEKIEQETFSLLANTYAGMGVSFFILLLAILHIVWKIEIHGGEVMRMNICIAIIVMQCVFLVGAHVKAEQTLCGFLSFLVYFCVLAEFCWLLLHALRIQGKIKKIFATNLNLEIVYVVIGWGLPLLMSIIAIGVQIDLKNPDDVCWKAAAGGAMWGYGAPVLLIALANVAVLVKLLIPTEEIKTEYDHLEMRYRVLKDALFLMFFGTTCTLAYQVVDKAQFKQQYYLSGTVVLQAVSMFIFGREGRKDFVKREPKREENQPSAPKEEETALPEEMKTQEEATGEEKAEKSKQRGRKKRTKPRHQPETMQVPTLRNLNIYMKDGQYVIEA